MMFPENSYLGKCQCGTEFMSPKGTMHCVSCLYKRISELENALLWSRDSNTGYEPSVSVMQRYYDELIPPKESN